MQRTVIVKMDGFHYDMQELNHLLRDKWQIISCTKGNGSDMIYVLEKAENEAQEKDV